MTRRPGPAEAGKERSAAGLPGDAREQNQGIEFLDGGDAPIPVARGSGLGGQPGGVVPGHVPPPLLFPHQTGNEIRDGAVAVVPVGGLAAVVLGVLAKEGGVRLGAGEDRGGGSMAGGLAGIDHGRRHRRRGDGTQGEDAEKGEGREGPLGEGGHGGVLVSGSDRRRKIRPLAPGRPPPEGVPLPPPPPSHPH
jgi:hypothetical protein